MLSPYIIKIHERVRRLHKTRRILFLTFLVPLLISITLLVLTLHRAFYQTQFDLKWWLDNQRSACDGNLVAYGQEFVWLKKSRYNREQSSFVVPCRTSIPRYWFLRGTQGTPYTALWSRLQTTDLSIQSGYEKSGLVLNTKVTFAVQRVEAHNIYHTMCELYNIFLLMKLFGLEKSEIAILFLDSRPPNAVDELWENLYGDVLRIQQVSDKTVFKDLIWIPIGYESPLHFHEVGTIPYMEDFHQLFINSFGVHHTKDLDCNHIKVTVILRHDYVSHPERLTLFQGKIHRKFENENDVLLQLRATIGQAGSVRGVTLETMSMKDQVELFSQTDILIGIHGAGLTHIISLPPHAVVLELRPYGLERKWLANFHHFRAIARWRRVRYISWTTTNTNDDIYSYGITVPLGKLASHVRSIHDSMCYDDVTIN